MVAPAFGSDEPVPASSRYRARRFVANSPRWPRVLPIEQVDNRSGGRVEVEQPIVMQVLQVSVDLPLGVCDRLAVGLWILTEIGFGWTLLRCHRRPPQCVEQFDGAQTATDLTVAVCFDAVRIKITPIGVPWQYAGPKKIQGCVRRSVNQPSRAFRYPRGVQYAAYGSNLDPSQMSARCPHSPLRGTGWLTGWRITFGGDGWDGPVPTLAEDPESQVYVALYDVTEADEAALDGWESADSGLYRKVRVRVATLDGELTAWVYVLNDFEGGMPSARTLGILADAAEVAGAPADYVAGLRSRPCASGW